VGDEGNDEDDAVNAEEGDADVEGEDAGDGDGSGVECCISLSLLLISATLSPLSFILPNTLIKLERSKPREGSINSFFASSISFSSGDRDVE